MAADVVPMPWLFTAQHVGIAHRSMTLRNGQRFCSLCWCALAKQGQRRIVLAFIPKPDAQMQRGAR